MLSDARKREVVERARAFVGTPFRHQGRDKKKGVDCLGLPILIAKDMGLVWQDWIGYDQFRADQKLVRKGLKEVLERNNSYDLGSIILFDGGNGMPHVAIVADGGAPYSLIHSHAERKKVVEAVFDVNWVKRVRGKYSFREL